jgi:hypothetical protein
MPNNTHEWDLELATTFVAGAGRLLERILLVRDPDDPNTDTLERLTFKLLTLKDELTDLHGKL